MITITDEMVEAGWTAVSGVGFEDVRQILTAALSVAPAGVEQTPSDNVRGDD